jgi:hypothetical protein
VPNGISRETFKNLSNSDQNAVLFDLLRELQNKACAQHKDCDDRMHYIDERIHNMESSKWRVTAWAAASGFIGGFTAAMKDWIK